MCKCPSAMKQEGKRKAMQKFETVSSLVVGSVEPQ
jgi:hypothetical protein